MSDSAIDTLTPPETLRAFESIKAYAAKDSTITETSKDDLNVVYATAWNAATVRYALKKIHTLIDPSDSNNAGYDAKALRWLREHVIDGYVMFPSGAPIKELKVQLAEHKSYKLEKGTEKETDGEGKFRYVFTGQIDEKRTWEIFASAEKISDGSTQSISISKPFCWRSDSSTLALVLPDTHTGKSGDTEYWRLNRVSKKIPWTNMVETQEQQDLSELADSSLWDLKSIALMTLSHKRSPETGFSNILTPEVLYGLFRMNLPTDLWHLSRVNSESVEEALKTANAVGIIGILSGAIDNAKKLFSFEDDGRFSLAEARKQIAPGARSTRSDFLGVLWARLPQLTADEKAKLERIWYAGVELSVATISGRVASTPAAQVLEAVEVHELLGASTRYSHEVVKALWNQLGTVTATTLAQAIVDKGLDTATGWTSKNIVTEAMEESTKTQYIEECIRNLHRTCATRSLAAQLKPGGTMRSALRACRIGEETISEETIDSVVTALRMGRPFDIGDGGITSAIASEAPKTREAIKVLARVYQVSRSDNSMRMLLKNKFTSAQDIVALPKESFLKKFTDASIPDADRLPEAEANEIYEKAMQVSAISQGAALEIRQLKATPPMRLFGDSAKIENLAATLAERLPSVCGNSVTPSYVEGDETRSIYSPSAYFVDLLDLTNPNQAVWQARDIGGKRPFEELIRRRPGLQYLPLTKQTAETMVPTIDLVNEILEEAVAGVVNKEGTKSAPGTEIIGPENTNWSAYTKLASKNYLNLPRETVLALVGDVDLESLSTLPYLPSSPGVGWSSGMLEEWAKHRTSAYMHGWSISIVEREGEIELAMRQPELTSDDLYCNAMLRNRFVIPELHESSDIEWTGMSLSFIKYLCDRGINWQHCPESRDLFIEDSCFNIDDYIEEAVSNDENVEPDITTDNSGWQRMYIRNSSLDGAGISRRYMFLTELSRDISAMDVPYIIDKLGGVLHLKQMLTSSPFDDSNYPYERILSIVKRLVYITERKHGAQMDALSMWMNIPIYGADSPYFRTFVTYGGSGFLLRPGANSESLRIGSETPDFRSRVFHALGLNDACIAKILERSGFSVQYASYSIAELSALYRYYWLAKRLNISVEKLIDHIDALHINPFRPLCESAFQPIAEERTLSSLHHYLDNVESAMVETQEFISLVSSRIKASSPNTIASDWMGAQSEGDVQCDVDLVRYVDSWGKVVGTDIDSLRTGILTYLTETTSISNALGNHIFGTPTFMAARLRDSDLPLSLIDAFAKMSKPGWCVYSTSAQDSGPASIIQETESCELIIAPEMLTHARGICAEAIVEFTETGTYILRCSSEISGDVTCGNKRSTLIRGVAHLGVKSPGDIESIAIRFSASSLQEYSFQIVRDASSIPARCLVRPNFGAFDAWNHLKNGVRLFDLNEADLTYLIRRDSKMLLPIDPDTTAGAERLRLFSGYVNLKSLGDSVASSLPGLLACIDGVVESYRSLPEQSRFDPLRAKLLEEIVRCTTSGDLEDQFRIDLTSKSLGWFKTNVVADWESMFCPFAKLRDLDLLETVLLWFLRARDLKTTSLETVNCLRQYCLGSYPASTSENAIELYVRERDQASRQAIMKRVHDVLRLKKRDALVTYLKDYPPPGVQAFHNDDELYAHFLIDTQVALACQTSRLQAAISSVQTFVQRILMNLENEVKPEAILEKEWQWMKRFQLWEAARKIFLYPENWLDPEFRTDKTELFRALESSITSEDMTEELAELAFGDYMRQLEALARLDVVASFVEASPSGGELMHVVARTRNSPSKYLYRRKRLGAWESWTTIPVEASGDHFVLGAWKGRMRLAWLTFLTEPIVNSPEISPGKTISLPDMAAPLSNVSVQIHWSDKDSCGVWSESQTSDPIYVGERNGFTKSAQEVFMELLENNTEYRVNLPTSNQSLAFTGRTSPPVLRMESSSHSTMSNYSGDVSGAIHRSSDASMTIWKRHILSSKATPWNLVMSGADASSDRATGGSSYRPFFYQDGQNCLLFHAYPAARPTSQGSASSQGTSGSTASYYHDRFNISFELARPRFPFEDYMDPSLEYSRAPRPGSDWLADPSSLVQFGVLPGGDLYLGFHGPIVVAREQELYSVQALAMSNETMLEKATAGAPASCTGTVFNAPSQVTSPSPQHTYTPSPQVANYQSVILNTQFGTKLALAPTFLDSRALLNIPTIFK